MLNMGHLLNMSICPYMSQKHTLCALRMSGYAAKEVFGGHQAALPGTLALMFQMKLLPHGGGGAVF
jgi:hypothetical protein